MRSLNLDQLRAFVEVAERGSFTAAARQLNLTQPAVTHQVQELERRFKVALVERLGKRAHLTQAGELLPVPRTLCLGVMMGLEVADGTTEFQPGVQARRLSCRGLRAR